MAAKSKAVPKGYISFENHILSEQGFAEGRRLYSEVALRHPQMQKEFVYIYNDFAGNGQCEVIENTLMEISSALGAAPRSDAALLRAWHLLEGLSVFVLTFFSEWTGVEDSAYVHVLVEVYASAVLTLSKALHEAGLLAKIHNAAQVLALCANVVKKVNEAGEAFTKAGPIIKAFSMGKSPAFDAEKYNFTEEAATLVGGTKYKIAEYLAGGGFRINMADIEQDRKDRRGD